MKNLKRIGWVPYCTKSQIKSTPTGFWPGWFDEIKGDLMAGLGPLYTAGFEFEIRPVFADAGRKRNK